MSRHRLPHVLVGLLLIAAAIYIARNTYWDDITVPTPLQGEAATNVYYSVQHLATSLGVQSQFLVTIQSPPARNGVFLVNGFQDDLTHTRVNALATWVEAGGRLIVTDDAVRADPKFQAWSGITLGTRFLDEKKPTPRPKPVLPSDPDADCVPIAVKTGGVPTGDALTLCIPPSDFGLVSKRKPVWSMARDNGLEVFRVSIGRGSVTVIPRNVLISNKNLVRHDHAQIFVEAADLQRGDRLFILNVTRAETLLALLWRVAAPALVFFGLAILCVILRELPRFGPKTPAAAMVRRSLAEQLRANASFAWRTRKVGALRKAVRRALDDTAQRRIAAYGGLDVRRRVAALASLTGVDPQALNSAMTGDAVATPEVQRAAIALLEQTRRILTLRTQKINQGRA